MATDITKSIESSLLELQKHAKEQKAKIVSISSFSEKVYGLMLEMLIEVENLHKKSYNENSQNELQHSCITFHIANPNEDGESFSLIFLTDVENPPRDFNLDNMQNNFKDIYLKIISECNANNKVQNFKISGMEISTFYNRLTMLIANNAALASRNETKANEPNVITIGLNLDE